MVELAGVRIATALLLNASRNDVSKEKVADLYNTNLKDDKASLLGPERFFSLLGLAEYHVTRSQRESQSQEEVRECWSRVLHYYYR